jgi:hypothetical protein
VFFPRSMLPPVLVPSLNSYDHIVNLVNPNGRTVRRARERAEDPASVPNPVTTSVVSSLSSYQNPLQEPQVPPQVQVSPQERVQGGAIAPHFILSERAVSAV